jgi:mRNA interferase HicA
MIASDWDKRCDCTDELMATGRYPGRHEAMLETQRQNPHLDRTPPGMKPMIPPRVPRPPETPKPNAGEKAVDARTELSETGIVKGGEFERRVRKLARSRKLTCQFVADKGKGSHGRLYLGDGFTTLKDRKKEIGRDLLAKMCADLKIDPHDL